MTQLGWSVVVPTYNRPEKVLQCVRALAQMDAPHGGFEIVVVNDGGVEVQHHLEAVSGTHASLRVLEQVNRGPAHARNHGAREARGTYLAFTDDDCMPSRLWLFQFDEAMRRTPGALLGGPVVNGLAHNIFAETSQRLSTFTETYFDGSSRERFFTSNNMGLERKSFFEAGGFNTEYPRAAGEDREFCDRWHSQGRSSVHVAGAVVEHFHDLSARTFFRQHAGYGRANVSFRSHRAGAGRPVRIEPGFYLASLRHAWRGAPRDVATVALTCAAHAAYASGVITELVRRKVSR